MPTPALYSKRKIFSTQFTPNNPIVINLQQQGVTTDFVDEIEVEVVGTLNSGAGAAGTATGKTNPEDILINATLQTNPVVATCLPINNATGRSLLVDDAFMFGNFRRGPAIQDGVGNETVSARWHLHFRRHGVRKGVEYGLDMTRYTGAILTLRFGDQTTLFTGSANTWDMTVLTVNVYVISAFNVQPDQIHSHELFEQTYPITQTQSDFLINNLSPGFLYTDFYYMLERNNLLVNDALLNIDIEGGGRTWLPQGDNNAEFLQKSVTLRNFDGSVVSPDDPSLNTNTNVITGIYGLSLKNQSGMYSRAVDSLTSQIISKLSVVFANTGPQLLRLAGRRVVPGAVYKKPPKAA
jgi:hypothetical protein